MARGWGDGGPTQGLHHLSFDMYATLAPALSCSSYRKLPVLSVRPGSTPLKRREFHPGWLDGNAGGASVIGAGEDTAQIHPGEFTRALLREAGARVVEGTCVGVNHDSNAVTGVRYRAEEGESLLECDAVVVSAGPWSCAAEEWFEGAVRLPMEGVKSTSLVWEPTPDQEVDGTALFCGEDERFGTHLEVYPRPDGTVYICGIGGSKYVTEEELKGGAFRGAIEADPARVDAACKSFKEMSARYRAHGKLRTAQACMRPCPPDALPYMGRIPGYQGAFVNAGHNCWGIAWAPACGKAMAELIMTGRSSSINLTPFDPARFTPTTKGGRGRKRRGQNVGEQW